MVQRGNKPDDNAAKLWAVPAGWSPAGWGAELRRRANLLTMMPDTASRFREAAAMLDADLPPPVAPVEFKVEGGD